MLRNGNIMTTHNDRLSTLGKHVSVAHPVTVVTILRADLAGTWSSLWTKETLTRYRVVTLVATTVRRVVTGRRNFPDAWISYSLA
jgi:hypothetical protein